MSRVEEQLVAELKDLDDNASPEDVFSGDSLFNYCCYHYLNYLVVDNIEQLRTFVQTHQSLLKDNFSALISPAVVGEYQPDRKYGDIYFDTMRALEALIENKVFEGGPNQGLLDALVCRVFDNDNKALEQSYACIADTIANSDSLEAIEKGIVHLCRETPSKNANRITPSQQGSLKGRLGAVLSSTYKPMFNTSLASVRRYAYQQFLKEVTGKELRLGTQGQRVGNKPRVSPLYRRFLTIQKLKLLNEEKADAVSIVYFNDLAYDRKDGLLKVEGPKETEISRALHQLEFELEELSNVSEGIELSVLSDSQKLEYPYSNLVVITTPADKGLMDPACLHHIHRDLPLNAVFDDLLSTALEENTGGDFVIRDFHISERSRKKIFGSDSPRAVFTALLEKSLTRLGLDQRKNISDAERQALWLYCIKYEFTANVLKALNPDYYHMSCKDGIDRGGVHSALYNLFASIDCGHPLTEDEFEQALHAAPTLVKGRGMNQHSERLWNVVDLYVQANEDRLKNTGAAWLITWRNKYRKNYHHALNENSLGLQFKLAAGIQEYLDTVIPDAHFKKDGARRAKFYKQLLAKAKTEKARLICCFALLEDPNGPTLKATLAKQWGLEKGQLSLVRAHIYNQLKDVFPRFEPRGGKMTSILGDIIRLAKVSKHVSGLDKKTDQILCDINTLGGSNHISSLNH